MPPLLQREDAVGVVGEFADQKDCQAIGGARRGGTFAEAAVLRDLVDPVADRGVKAERPLHP